MNQFKKRDRIVTPDGLGHVTHAFNSAIDHAQNYSVKLITGKVQYYPIESLRPATFKDFKKGKAEIFKDAKTKKWDYRLIAKNGNLLNHTRQGYSNRVDMIDVLNNNHIQYEIVEVGSTKMNRKKTAKA